MYEISGREKGKVPVSGKNLRKGLSMQATYGGGEDVSHDQDYSLRNLADSFFTTINPSSSKVRMIEF